MKAQDIHEKFFRDGKLLVITKKLKSKQVLFAYLQEELAKKGLGLHRKRSQCLSN